MPDIEDIWDDDEDRQTHGRPAQQKGGKQLAPTPDQMARVLLHTIAHLDKLMISAASMSAIANTIREAVASEREAFASIFDRRARQADEGAELFAKYNPMVSKRFAQIANDHRADAASIRAAGLLTSTPSTPQSDPDPLPRKLALSLYETWTFVLLWAVGQAQDRGGKMHRVHAAILARLHDAMTSAATAGLLPGDSTARLPGLLAEHGFDLEDLLRETAPVETKEPSHG
ncbi:hypothetical protein [Azospirillum argentinense]